MRLFSLLLVVLGGINWGLVGLTGIDAINGIFGAHTIVARGIHVCLGLAALYQLVLLLRLIDTPLERRALT